MKQTPSQHHKKNHHKTFSQQNIEFEKFSIHLLRKDRIFDKYSLTIKR